MIKVGRKETMSVAELREKLNEYPQDMPVFAAWEGVFAPFKPECCGTQRYENIDVLYIDVENY